MTSKWKALEAVNKQPDKETDWGRAAQIITRKAEGEREALGGQWGLQRTFPFRAGGLQHCLMQTGESVGAGGARHEDEEWTEAPVGLKGERGSPTPPVSASPQKCMGCCKYVDLMNNWVWQTTQALHGNERTFWWNVARELILKSNLTLRKLRKLLGTRCAHCEKRAGCVFSR